ncbi:MAG: hypothetical protein H6679_00035 [Epsilonproteobacteria bacterium]|nr:hypothetical protein [Campylobacterota bacterium]
MIKTLSNRTYLYITISDDKLAIYHLLRRKLSLTTHNHQIIPLNNTQVYDEKIYNLTSLKDYVSTFIIKNKLNNPCTFVFIDTHSKAMQLLTLQLTLMLSKAPLNLEFITTTPIMTNDKPGYLSSLSQQKNLLQLLCPSWHTQILPWATSFVLTLTIGLTVLHNVKKNTKKQHDQTIELLTQKQTESDPLRSQLSAFHKIKKENTELEQRLSKAQRIKKKMLTHLQFLIDIAQQLPESSRLISLQIGRKQIVTKNKSTKPHCHHYDPTKKESQGALKAKKAHANTPFLIEGYAASSTTPAQYADNLGSCKSIQSCELIAVKKQKGKSRPNQFRYKLSGKLVA